ncbi:MAG: PAS domain S-box protein [Gammaproteobacteria bacterium]
MPPIPDDLLHRWQKRVDLLATIIDVPVCSISQLGTSFSEIRVTSQSDGNPYKPGDRESNDANSYDKQVLTQSSSLYINDARANTRWQNSPELAHGLISYIGCLLQWPTGEPFGILCVLSTHANSFSEAHRELLEESKHSIEHDLEKLTGTQLAANEGFTLWQAIQSAALESILVMDTQGTFLSANETGAARFGMTPKELVGKNLYNIVPADVAKRRKTNIGNAIRAKQSMRFEDFREGHYFDFTVYPVLNDQNEVDKVVVFAADITERRLTRQALEKSERKYRELVEEASTIILRWDINGNVTFFNEYAQQYFGFTEADILGKNVVGTIVPETEFTGRDLAQLMNEIQRDPDKFRDNENENIKRNGERVWIAWKNRPIFNERGELREIHSVGIDITARKRAEDALRESEALWRSLTESSPDHIVTLDENLNIQFVNFASPGLDKTQLIGTPIYNYVAIKHKENVKQLLEHALKTGERCSYETEYADPDGNIMYYESVAAPKIVDDKVAGLTINARDVTERKRVEDALRTSEERLRMLISEADFILWSADKDLKFTSSFGGGLYALGLEPEQVVNVGLDLYQFFRTESPNFLPLKAHIDALQGKSVTYENEWMGRYFHNHISPQRDTNGHIIGCIGVATDITDRKRAEEALKESEERHNQAQAVGHVGTWEWKPQTGVLIWSSETYRILGYAPNELNPSYDLFFEHVHPDDRQYLRETVDNAIHNKRPYNIDCRIIATNDVEKIVNLQGNVRYDEEGNPLQMLGTFQDITDRKQIEKELEQYRNHLEELVALRTAELESSNKELESYSYSIAHDLRAPLRAIIGFSQILKDDTQDKLDTEEINILQRIIAAGKNMSELIDDILELSRITRSELHFGTADLASLGNAVMARLTQSQLEREARWQVDDDLVVHGDARLLEVAIQNLIENAWKYTRKQKVAEIHLGKTTINGETTYYVKDNGVGFDMQYANQLFKPFHRLHSPTEFEGTGIGLATVQRIIQRHGGRIWADTQENCGATFYFTLRQKKFH